MVDEIDGGEEASPRSGSDALACDRDGKMGLANSRFADQHGVALLGEQGARGDVADQSLVDGRILEGEVVVLGERQAGDI